MSNLSLQEAKAKKIYYCVPGLLGISGGVAVILQHVTRLRKRGWNIRMVTEAYDKQCSWFPEGNTFKDLQDTIPEYKGDADLLISTSNSTAHTSFVLPAKKKAYFVQSDESRFYPGEVSAARKAWETYLYPYHCFTEAKWIKTWLETKFKHRDVGYVPNGLDLDILKPNASPLIPKEPGGKPRVLIEGSMSLPIKGVGLGIYALQKLRSEGKIEIWVLSANGVPSYWVGCDRAFESVPMDKVSEIYNSCDILIKPSMVEGLPGPQMEGMKCGLPVITFNCTGVEDYAVHERNCLIINKDSPQIVKDLNDAVQRLLDDQSLRETLIVNGKNDMEEWTWDRGIDMLEQVLLDILNREYEQDPVNLDQFIIPTLPKNALQSMVMAMTQQT